MIEMDHLEDIAPYVLAHDLTLVDIDDVIITPAQYGPSTSWTREYMRYHLERKSEDLHTIIQQLQICFKTTQYRPVCEEGIRILSDLSATHPILGFTARALTLADNTSNWLREFGMKFSALSTEASYKNDEGFEIIKDGVIYAGGEHPKAKLPNKGKALEHLIRSNWLPFSVKKLLYIDDSLAHHHEIQAACERLGIEYTGIHLTKIAMQWAAKEWSGEILATIGEIQTAALLNGEKVPSDEEAYIMVTSSTKSSF